MHFEASDQLIRTWADKGFFHPAPVIEDRGLSYGDRGPEVEAAQAALNGKVEDGLSLVVDGIFGKDTRTAVLAFQRDKGLPVSGIVTPETARALGLRP